MCIRTINQPDRQGTPDVNGKLNNIDSLIKTIKYNELWRCGRLQSSQIYQHQLTIRAPTLCASTNLRLLVPTKRSLRNPTLRVHKTQLACKIENKTTTATAQTINHLPNHCSTKSTFPSTIKLLPNHCSSLKLLLPTRSLISVPTSLSSTYSLDHHFYPCSTTAHIQHFSMLLL